MNGLRATKSEGVAMGNILDKSVITITGGTGSFGSTMARHLLANENISEIRIFSRDENKQDQMRKSFNDERLRFYIGDVRDRASVDGVIKGTDFIFHAAALKQVPSCEFFPQEAIATNIMGSNNVLDSAISFGVNSIVCLSTDKAVYPINAMGISKAMMEKVAQAKARDNQNSDTRISVTRYGNVMLSRGSVIPLFVNQIKSGKAVTITNPRMTRFMMSLDDSVELVKYAFTNANTGDLFVRKAPACTVQTLVSAIAETMNKSGQIEVQTIGTRHGEKLFESLLGIEEKTHSEDLGEYFRVPLDTRTLDYQVYFDKGIKEDNEPSSFTSHDTIQLDVDETKKLLLSLPEYMKMISA